MIHEIGGRAVPGIYVCHSIGHDRVDFRGRSCFIELSLHFLLEVNSKGMQAAKGGSAPVEIFGNYDILGNGVHVVPLFFQIVAWKDDSHDEQKENWPRYQGRNLHSSQCRNQKNLAQAEPSQHTSRVRIIPDLFFSFNFTTVRLTVE